MCITISPVFKQQGIIVINVKVNNSDPKALSKKNYISFIFFLCSLNLLKNKKIFKGYEIPRLPESSEKEASIPASLLIGEWSIPLSISF